MTNMFCFDTNLLIWGVQGVSTPNRIRMIDITRRFIASLPANETIMIPSIVLAEYLQGFTGKSKREEQLAILHKRYYVPPFDVPCANLAAELSQAQIASEVAEEVGRKIVKADIQIIATAIHHGADAIVTGNRSEYERLAGGRIRVIEVPVIEEQPSLLSLLDSEEQPS
jgi:predicted nucleic acid-binding protein